ncbi:MAG TPA: type II toxin-antitoxin system HicB family antitoxin [Terriglobales bacterium]|nr:type II toxin-antitoxin system HicB family antitoxin [Terriglobales bacterium]
MSANRGPAARRPAMEHGYTVVFEPLPEGGYGVSVPAIPEITTFGATLEEARGMAKDALRCFLESALEAGEPIPCDLASVTTERLAVMI